MTKATMTMYTVFNRPADLPEVEYAVREFHIVGGQDPIAGDIIAIHRTLEGARALIPPEAGYCQPRQPGDEPQIVETWF